MKTKNYKGIFRTAALLAASVFMMTGSAIAQNFNNAGEYMNFMSEEHRKISTDTWDYMKSVAHGKSARKVEKRRSEMINTIGAAKARIKKMPGFEGDVSLRDSVVKYLTINYKVLNQDFAEIVDMEAIAEQSYDLMEAYIMAQEKAGEKLHEANQMVADEQKVFAKNHNVNLVEEESKLSKKIAEANKVMSYYNQAYLIFFKSYKQEAYLLDAVAKKDVSGIQQNKNTLAKYSKEGITKLKELGDYKGDSDVRLSCQKLMNFYIDESNNAVPAIVDYTMKNENYVKIKDAFESIKQSKRTQADVDKYNKAGQDLNAAGAKYNELNNKYNAERAQLINKWNKTVSGFLDTHTAH